MATFFFGTKEPGYGAILCSPGSMVNCEYNNVIKYLDNYRRCDVVVLFVGSRDCPEVSVCLISCSYKGRRCHNSHQVTPSYHLCLTTAICPVTAAIVKS